MNSFAPYALAGEPVSAELSESDRYQWIKFRVFDLTLEHLERQGLDADTIPHAALQDQIAGAISVALQGNVARASTSGSARR